jgi:hypothetical protein
LAILKIENCVWRKAGGGGEGAWMQKRYIENIGIRKGGNRAEEETL